MNRVLYKVSVSTNEVQIWEAWTEGNRVFSRYGQQGGKLQTKSIECEPKNIGRSNETTANEQAIKEMEAMYKDQIDNKHYRNTLEEAKDLHQNNRVPMKVSNYKDRYSKMSPTLSTSIKKNGSRGCCLQGQMFSKVGRPEDVKVPHLKAVIEELGELATFDSEVFAEGLSLQRIRSAWLKPYKTDKEVISLAKNRIKKLGQDVEIISYEDALDYLGYNPNDDAPLLKFHIFDIPLADGKTTFEERVEKMREFELLIKSKGLDIYFEFLYPVYTHSHEERMQMLSDVCAKGEEGLVHYELYGVYEFGKKSTNIAKSKPRLDAEAFVIGVEKCKNGEGKLIMTCCDALDNVPLKAMMRGDHASRMLDVQKQFIGQWVTFEYEELSDIGVPTKATVRETRPCDNEGNPLS